MSSKTAVLIVGLLILIGMIISVSIIATKNTEKHNKEPIQDKDVTEYIDKETGIHYLIYRDVNGVGMSVRYNKDGSIMKENNNES